MTQTISVGQPFPGPVPDQDGLGFEIGPDGDMVLLIQMHNQREEETQSLEAGFERYSLYVQSGSPYVAVWVFKFPAPFRYMDAPFHAGLYHDNRIEKMLAKQGNALQVYVLDGNIVKVIKLVGLSHQAAADFRAVIQTIQQQLTRPFDRQEYDRAINEIFQLSSEELFRRGKQYRHGGEA